jgi:1-acyl-sn-glycerol-3-phosphate acyltransferase
VDHLRALIRLLALGLVLLNLAVSRWLLTLIYPFVKLVQPGVSRVRLAGRVMQWHCRALLACCGVRLQVKYRFMGGLPASHALLLANHVNYIDILALASLKPMAFVAKEEVGEWFGLGPLIRRLNTVFVRRESVRSRVRCIHQLWRRLPEIPYCVFPQGTTSLTPYMEEQPWFAGQVFCIRQPRVRLFAVGLRYEHHEKMAWVDEMALLPHLWWLLRRRRSELGIMIEEIELCTSQRGADLRQLSHDVRHTINRLSEHAEQLLSRERLPPSLVSCLSSR